MKKEPISVNLKVTKISKHVSKFDFDEEPELSNSSPERTKTHPCDYGREETHGDKIKDMKQYVIEINKEQKVKGFSVHFDTDTLGGQSYYVPADKVKQWFEHLSSAEPEQRWIPCDKKLPEGLMVNALISAVDNDGLPIIPHVATFDGFSKTWKSSLEISKVLAWMPLPTPYEERRTDEETDIS